MRGGVFLRARVLLQEEDKPDVLQPHGGLAAPLNSGPVLTPPACVCVCLTHTSESDSDELEEDDDEESLELSDAMPVDS